MPNQGKPICVAPMLSKPNPSGELILDHYIFKTQGGWQKSESMRHPTLTLQVTTNDNDYLQLNRKCPQITPCQVTMVSDTGAQSCLWGTQGFFKCGFRESDLIPVKRVMLAANHKQIKIMGAVFIRLSGKDCNGKIHTALVMVYITPDTKRFYLSREAMVQLRVISENFPTSWSCSRSYGNRSSQK